MGNNGSGIYDRRPDSASDEIVTCIDCGCHTDKYKAEWGHNSWSDKKHSKEEHGYVCPGCWNGRAMKMMR